jgi:thiol:disulfide interchange protein DsbD
VQPALAQDAEDGLLPVTEAYKLSADAGTPGVIKLHWVIAPDYYLYRGRMKFKAGDGVTLGEAQLPDGKKHHDEFLGDVETYHGTVDASVPYTVAPGTQRLKLSVQYQGCHEVEPKICYPPHTEQLDLPLPGDSHAAAADASAGTLGAALNQLGVGKPGGPTDGASQGMDAAPLPAEQAFRFEALARSPTQLLLRWSMPKGYYLYRDQTRLQLKDASGLQLGKPAWPAGGVAHQDANFGNVIVYFDQVELPVAIEGDTAAHKSLQLEASFQGCQDGGLCYPLMTRAVSIDLGSGTASAGVATETAPQAPPADLLAKAATPASTEFTAALLFGALLGGLLLNLMPCVLPVLSLKVIGVLENASELRALRRHAVFYTAGVLVSFAILAVIAHLFGKGLGAQLQNPTMVAVLVCVMLAVGLWLSGVVEFGGSLGNVGQSLAARKGPSGDFFTGVLAVLVATPCTGPFMGPPVAYALSAPLLQSLLIFITLGLGLALPILAIAAVPALARLLPRPGRWMETLKQVLAFPMYLTAVWLVWVLAKQRGADAVGLVLVSAVLLAMTLWWFERSRSRGGLSRAIVAVLALATLVPLYYVAKLPPASAVAVAEDGVVAYTPEKLAELRKAGTPVFVDMTADWCVTCKANEHAVLNTDAFRALLKRTGAVYMKGDWTDVNPTIASFLQQYHSPGVPLYVVFPKNGGDGRKLSTVLTSSLVEQALTEAAQ